MRFRGEIRHSIDFLFFSSNTISSLSFHHFQHTAAGTPTTKKMFLLTVATCMLALLSSVRCEADSKPSVENGVLVLTQANFQAAIKENEFVLVEFCKYPIHVFFPSIIRMCESK